MQERTDWGEIRQAIEAGASVAEAAMRFGVARSAVNTKTMREDWGGLGTRCRRDKVVRMLLRAGEKLAGADDMEAVERQARRLTALGAMAKALRAFDPRLAAADAREEEDDDFSARQRDYDSEVERLIEERVQERVDALARDV
jgi:transposase-like protein